MTNYFAEINENNIVGRVLVGQDDPTEAAQWLENNLGGVWVQTFRDGRRGNYAGVGFTYDETLDAFIPPKPSDDATLEETTFTWVVPEPTPEV